MLQLFFILSASICAISATVLPRQNAVHLAVSPNCGSLSSGTPADVNAGLKPLSSYKTIVSFGEAYSNAGVSDGSTPPPAVLSPPDPLAGGRLSNGPVWVESLASLTGATLKDYAMIGAVTDETQYPGRNSSARDLQGQLSLYTDQLELSHLDQDTTLYTVFFGIEDFVVSEIYDDSMESCAEAIIYDILELTSSPVFARNILVLDNYGRGTTTTAGESYKKEVFSGLNAVRNAYGINVGFVDFKTIWDGVLNGSPGYEAFGYTSIGPCVENTTTLAGACDDPDHAFYWLPGEPTKVTHDIMATYVDEVLTQCTSS